MNRKLTGHKANPANDRLDVEVMDQPGAGGACHRYDVTGYDSKGNPSSVDRNGYESSHCRTIILFQNGPISENGVNGLTHEVLLEIVADRLRSFQAGPFKCRENAIALTKTEEAILWLQKRTRDRMARNVEGTSEA